MELLLTKDVQEIGKKGDVVRVRDGFGRNFLIPQDLAIPATRANQKFFQEQRARNVIRKAKEKEAFLKLGENITGWLIEIKPVGINLTKQDTFTTLAGKTNQINSNYYRALTNEVLAFLNWLKRYSSAFEVKI